MNVDIMDIEQQQQIRYDRQIRLWGDEGQSSIQQARICVFGSSALAAEILKNLVLAGIGSFDIIDDALVKPADLGQNFFLVESAIGKYRGECLVQLLMELNPSVHGQHAAVPFSKFSQHDLKSLLQFSLVIGTNMAATEAIQLDQFLFAHQIPFVFARVQGLLGHLRLSFREHVIWNSHSENDAYDLRLDKPFSELLKLSAETDLERMSHEQHSHTPYILLYFKAIDIWRKRHRGDIVGNDKSAKVEAFPDIKNYKTRKELEAILMEMRQPDDKGSREEENFAEAKRNLLKSMGRTKVPDNVRQLLADPKANCISSNPPVRRFPELYEKPSVDHFWALCTALRQFIAQHDCLPVCGQLPDMTSDSKRYAQLLSVYRNKFVEDAAQLQAMATEILRQRQLGQNAQSINAATAKLKTKAKQSSRSETEDESTTDEMGEAEDEVEDEDDQLSRMSTTDAGEQVALVEEEQGMEEGTAATATAGSGGNEYFYHRRGDSGSNQMSNSSESSTDGFGAISVEQCQKYCKNATKIGIQYGSSLSSEFTSDIGPILRRVQQPPNLEQQPQQVDPLLWYVLLRTVDRFRAKNDRMPTEPNDLRELKRCLTELFAETKDVDLIGRRDELVPTEMLNEMLRFGASEPHVIAAILGGCVAQEAIKLCTRQYIPVDNSLVFDGHSQQATTFRITTSAHK